MSKCCNILSANLVIINLTKEPCHFIDQIIKAVEIYSHLCTLVMLTSDCEMCNGVYYSKNHPGSLLISTSQQTLKGATLQPSVVLMLPYLVLVA